MAARTITVATIMADIATLDVEDIAKVRALLGVTVRASAEPSEASAHYIAKDLPCPAAKPCEKTFRSAKGAEWHAANIKH